ncbi:RNA-binding protein YhbY [Oxobacter pfennigii]|uniref:RNA-binding protein YhbY n=1 Tax=Oxobacter pfennigii TaxID=36849 RepID=A0A0P8W639_9CLOT|nr:ribosome assembly RNA-binding protein YhbY [Oxobacter pfennigii]KPU44162.1 RNA-binding protein YhbY [Oxobacter pfennigii]
MNSKQRAYLRSLANTLNPVLILGKGGIDEDVVKQADGVLETKELIKISVLQNSSITSREACEMLCEATGAEPVQVIGNKFVIYRKSMEKPYIELP